MNITHFTYIFESSVAPLRVEIWKILKIDFSIRKDLRDKGRPKISAFVLRHASGVVLNINIAF